VGSSVSETVTEH
jgi:chromosome segregation ATPase